MTNKEIDLKEEYLKFIVNIERLNDALFELKELNRTVKSKTLKELYSEFKFATSEIIDATKALAVDQIKEARILLGYEDEGQLGSAKTDE